jgi:hypothetical protein
MADGSDLAMECLEARDIDVVAAEPAVLRNQTVHQRPRQSTTYAAEGVQDF